MSGQFPTDDQMNEIMDNIYNHWFARWKDCTELTDDKMTELYRVADQLIEVYAQFPVVENLVITFLYEISARAHGGYTKAMHTKIRDLMEVRYGGRMLRDV